MMRRFLGLALMVTMIGGVAGASQAEPIPDNVLAKDYDNCMGGDSDPQRAEYCACVRDSMKSWDLDTYGAVATEQAKAGANTQDVSAKIQEIAQTCIKKVLK